MGVKGHTVGSMSNLKKSLKKGSGGFLKRIPSEGLVVRFQTEPDKFVEYREHYSDAEKFFPCADECPGCEAGLNYSVRYLAPAVDVTESRAEAVVIPKSLMTKLVRKYDRHGTVMDRNYELLKSGSTKNDTEYDLEAEDPSRFQLSRYEPIDLMARLTAQLPNSSDDDEDLEDEDWSDEDDDDEDKRPAKKIVRKPPAKAVKKVVHRRPSSTTSGRVVKKAPAKATPVKKIIRRK